MKLPTRIAAAIASCLVPTSAFKYHGIDAAFALTAPRVALRFIPDSPARGMPPRRESSAGRLRMSLRPAAAPLMDSGKALARSGELLIEATSKMGLYGGALSAVGANVRNCGDCVAQAAASCRFKTAAELVTDELREASTCLLEGVDKMKQAAEEARTDKDEALAKRIEATIQPLSESAILLEAAGAGIMQRLPLSQIGANLHDSGLNLEDLATRVTNLAPDIAEAAESSNRMAYAAEKMKEAGDNLRGTKLKKVVKGKSWIKG